MVIFSAPPQPLPPPPPSKVLKVEGSWAFNLERAKRRLLEDMPGAVVVVEEDALPPIALKTMNLKFGKGWFRIGQKWTPKLPSHIDLPKWMDPNITHSGGNVVHRNYPIGWGY